MLMQAEYKHTDTHVNKLACFTFDKPACTFSAMRYGERLKRAREHADLSQTALAEMIEGGCTQANISQLETSLTATGSEYTVQIARACKVSADWLAEEKGDMIDAYALADERIRKAAKIMESLPSYAIDHVLREIDETAKLINHAGHHGETATQ